ncbi:TonB-dependent receptor domain-containing protein [Magnetococcales bacterium HHB-1]
MFSLLNAAKNPLFKKSVLLSSILSASFLQTAIADNDIPTIVVTATRTATPKTQTIAPVTVLTRADIEKKQTQNIPELLAALPGIDIVQNGGAGANTSLYMRGTNAGHVLVLVNGRKMGSATTGTISWQYLPVAQIERIEIIRGPRSSLYGSEAIGGVIQIFTRQGMQGFNVDLEMGAGSWNTRHTSAIFSGGAKRSQASLGISLDKSGGYNVKQFSSANNAANDPDDDGHKNEAISVNLSHKWPEWGEVEADFFHAKTQTEYDATNTWSTTDENASTQQSLGLKLTLDPLSWLKTTLSWGTSRDDSKSFSVNRLDNIFNTHRRNASAQFDLLPAKGHVITVGADYMDEQISGTSNYDLSQRYDRAAFLQYQGMWRRLNWVLGIREGRNEQFGRHFTGNAEFGFKLSDNLRLISGYGSAYKAPSFNDLYFPDTAFVGKGNPSLQPEESVSYELGLAGETMGYTWSARRFHTDIKGLISWSASAGNPFYWTPDNSDDARIRGLELELGGMLADFDIELTATLLDPEDKATGLQLSRRAKQSYKLDVGYAWEQWPMQVNATLRAQSTRYNDSANLYPVAGFSVIDLTGTYDLSETWQGRLKISNLLDKRYRTTMATATPYDAPGRNIFFSLAWKYSQ